MLSRTKRLPGLVGLVSFALLLVGCGGSPSVPNAAAVPNSNLAGNWSLVGSLPVLYAPISAGTRLAVTFSVDGSQVTGAGEYLVSCGNIGGGGSIRIQGTIAANGSFTAQTTTPASGVGASLSVSGHVPSSAGAPWTGSYALDTTNAGGCQEKAQDTVTAQPIVSFSGNYTGIGTYTDGETQTPVSLRMVLQQGITVQDAAGQSTTDTALVNGSVTISGVPCFSHGSATVPVGVLELQLANIWGDSLHATFSMDDGSSLALSAAVGDASGDLLVSPTALILQGKCAAPAASLSSSPNPTLRITSLTRSN